MRKKYCMHCQNEIDFDVIEERTEAIVRGKNVSYISKTAKCPICFNELYVSEINDENINRLEAAYRKQEDIISIKEINDILDMYHIGKRPLSRLLGFGEITVTRFLEGKLPSKKSSDILKGVLNSTEKMREYVDNNTDEALENACEKVVASIKEIESVKEASKIVQVTQYFLINLEDSTNMAINKLLHFAQVSHYMVFGTPLFVDESQAWVHGPVYSDIYQKYKKYRKDVILPTVKNDRILNLTSQERDILEEIILYFGCYSATTLRNMSHIENIWLDARDGLNKTESSEEPIKLKDIESYALMLRDVLDIKSVDDIQKYSDYLRNCELNNSIAIG